MAFNGEGVVAVLLEPLRLLIERGARLHRELGRIRLKEHAVADIDDKVLLTAWRGHAGCCKRVGRLVLGAGAKRQPRDQLGHESCTVDDTRHRSHPGASFLRVFAGPSPHVPGGSLSERSVNLDEALSNARKKH